MTSKKRLLPVYLKVRLENKDPVLPIKVLEMIESLNIQFDEVSKAVDRRGSQLNIFLFLHKNICCGYSLEEAQCRNKKNISTVWLLTLKAPITTIIVSALSSASYFKSHCCKQCGPRSDCSSRRSLIWVHTVCLFAKKYVWKVCMKIQQTTKTDDILRCMFSWRSKG